MLRTTTSGATACTAAARAAAAAGISASSSAARRGAVPSASVVQQRHQQVCLFSMTGGGNCQGSRPEAGNSGRVLTEDNVFGNLVRMEYAVRGPLLIRALELEKELKKVSTYAYTCCCAAGSCVTRGVGVCAVFDARWLG